MIVGDIAFLLSIASIITSIVLPVASYFLTRKQIKLLEMQTKMVGFSYEPELIPAYKLVSILLDGEKVHKFIEIKNRGPTAAFNITAWIKVFDKSGRLIYKDECFIDKLMPNDEKSIVERDIDYSDKRIIIELSYMSFHGIRVFAKFSKDFESKEFVLKEIKHEPNVE